MLRNKVTSPLTDDKTKGVWVGRFFYISKGKMIVQTEGKDERYYWGGKTSELNMSNTKCSKLDTRGSKPPLPTKEGKR